MNIVPTIIEKSYDKEYAYDLYSRLLKDRIIFITGEINDNNANIVISELLYLDSLSNEDISIYINSPGGSITSGMAIYDTMNYVKSDVKTIVIGMAASMAAFLLACGTKGKRYALLNSEVMIHQPLGGAQGQVSDIQIQANHIQHIKERMNKMLSENTGKALDIVEKDTDRDNYMTAQEAKDYGIIDEIFISRNKKA